MPVSCFENLKVVKSLGNITKRFGSVIKPMMVKIGKKCDEIHTLSHIRDALLPKLLSGEIRVRDAEKLVGEMMG